MEMRYLSEKLVCLVHWEICLIMFWILSVLGIFISMNFKVKYEGTFQKFQENCLAINKRGRIR